jgi:hypothetical protein
MTLFLGISLAITGVLILLASIWRENDNVFLPCILLLVMQSLFGYFLLGIAIPWTSATKEVPITAYEIVRGKDRVYLIQNGKTIKEFTDAKTVMNTEYKTVEITEFYNGYNFILDNHNT